MMLVQGGATNVTTYFQLRKAADGTAATALTITGIDMQYVRDVEVPTAKVDCVALAATNTAHTDGRGIEIDATDQPGLYRFDWPDAAFAAGTFVYLTIKEATIFTETLAVQLVGADVTSVTRGFTGTAVPAAAADAAGGLPISDAGSKDFDAMVASVTAIEVDTGTTLDAALATVDANVDAILVDTGTTLDGKINTIDGIVDTILVDTNELQGDWTNTGRLDTILDSILADTAELQGDWVNGGRLDLIIDAILADTAELQGDWTNAGRLDAILDLILADTGELQVDWANGGRLDLILDARASQTTADAVETDTQDIQSRLPAALSAGGNLDANVAEVNDAAAAAVRLGLSSGQMVPGTVDGVTFTSTTTEFECDDITEATADHFNGRNVLWTTGALAGQMTDITDYVLTGSNGHFTVTAMTEAPANNDTCIIV